MAKKVIIAELDIDTDALIKKNALLLGQLTELKGSQKDLRKETSNLNDATDEQLKTYAKTDAELKDLNKTYNQQKTILAEATTGVKSLSEALDKEVKSVNDAKDNNSKLIKLRNTLNTKTKEGADAIGQINKKIGDNNAVIKTNVSELEKQRLNIGNYATALDGVIPGLSGFISGIQGTSAAAKASVGSLNAFKIALISTGIGAIVVAIGLLVAGFMSTTSGANRVNKIMTQIGATVDVLLGRIGKLADGIISFLSGDFSGGIEKIGSAFDGVTDAINETIRAAVELADLKIDNAELLRSSSITIAVLEQERDKYEQLRDDSTRSFLVRENASRKLMEVEKKLARERVLIRTREMGEIASANAIIINAGNELTSEQKDAFIASTVAFKEAQTEQKTIELQNEKERRTLVQDRLEKDLDILIDGFDNQKSINERRIADERLTFEKRNEILEETIKLSDDSLNKQVETLQKFTQKKIDINDLLATSDAVVLNEKIRMLGLSEIIEGRLLEVIRDRRTAEVDLAEVSIDLLEEQLAAEVEIEKQREKLHIDTEKSIQDKIATGRAILFEEELVRLEEEGASRLAIRLTELDEAERLEREKIENSVEDEKVKQRRLTLVEKEFSDVRKQIKFEEEQAKLLMVASIAGQIANIFGRETVLGKAAAIAQATINTWQGATLALATIPAPFGAIQAGVTIAAGLKSVGKIVGVSLPKFATGTNRVLGDGTETSDSVHAMLSKNERIVDAKNNRKIGFDLSNDQLATAAQMYRSFNLNGGISMNNTGMIEAINKNTRAIKGKPVSRTTVHVSDGLRAVNKSKYLS